MQLKQNEIDAIVGILVSNQNEVYQKEFEEAKKYKPNILNAKKWSTSILSIPLEYRGGSTYSYEYILNDLAKKQTIKHKPDGNKIRNKVIAIALNSTTSKELLKKLNIDNLL